MSPKQSASFFRTIFTSFLGFYTYIMEKKKRKAIRKMKKLKNCLQDKHTTIATIKLDPIKKDIFNLMKKWDCQKKGKNCGCPQNGSPSALAFLSVECQNYRIHQNKRKDEKLEKIEKQALCYIFPIIPHALFFPW